MRKQQQIWQEEHTKNVSIPSLGVADPASYVISFIENVQLPRNHSPLKVIDIGCGKGRNAIYLAKKGFDVYAVDYSSNAVSHAEKEAKKIKLKNPIHFFVQDIDKKWPFEDNFFDLAIDCFSSIDIETAQGREIYKNEMLRTLKQKGLALVTVVSANDEIEKEFIKKYPGKEKNSVIWPTNGKFQKNYDELELREFYKQFTLLALEEKQKKAYKLDQNYIASNYYLIVQKP